jgi:hypothetical protein
MRLRLLRDAFVLRSRFRFAFVFTFLLLSFPLSPPLFSILLRLFQRLTCRALSLHIYRILSASVVYFLL